MKLTIQEPSTRPFRTSVAVVFAVEGTKPALPSGVKISAAAEKDFKGEFREVRVADALAGPAERVLMIGLGKKDALDADRLRRVAALAVQRAEGMSAPSAAMWIDPALFKRVGGAERAGTVVAEGAVMGSYRFEACKSKPKGTKLKSLTLVAGGSQFKYGVERGEDLARANCFVRDLQNKPGNLMTPRDLAAAAKSLAGGKIRCKVLDAKAMKALGMGLLLGVARGSREAPRLIHLVYKPRGRSKGKIALVGKGLTFDAGGISLKPSAKMDEMRFDMSGGAAVLGVFHALRHIEVPYEVHGIVPTTENMPGGAATKPGDIHTAMNGTTVEILNTDAEGRLILADALCYAIKKVEPDTIIDLATLTGAVVTALGHEVSGMFASTDKLRDELVAAGEATGERVWPLPLLDHHKDQMKGVFADLKNISGGDMGAGSSAGAAFLAPFVGDTEWAHLDIAGTAWGGSNRDWVGGNLGSGVGTRLLLSYLENRR